WFHDQPVTQAVFSPDGRRVLSVCKDGKLRLWDASTGKAVGEPMDHAGGVTQAQFSRDGSRILSAAADFTVHLWDASTGKAAIAPLEHAGPILACALRSDGRRLHTISSNPRTLQTAFQAWGATSGEPIGEPWMFDQPLRLATFSPDGQLILAASLG